MKMSIQYIIKLYLIGAFSYKIGLSILSFTEGAILFWLANAFYGLIFLLFAIIYKPSKEGNTSPIVILVALSHVGCPLLFESRGIAISHYNLFIAYLFLICGLLVSAFSLLDLGKSFDVLPAKRDIVTKGMYKFVRHPIYLGYFLAALGTLTRSLSIYNSMIFCLLLSLTLLRIFFEEKELSKSSEYEAYKNKTRYRLIPKIY